MNVSIAKTFLVRERLDWKTPHLRWMADSLYRRVFSF